MSYWSWDSSLSIGVDVIDEQHRRIVDYINELDVAFRKKDREKISEVLTGLTDYTITHFMFEEDLMVKSGYPLSDSHMKVHESFTARINEYVEQHENGKNITRKLMAELRIWLTQHINRDDKDYAPFARKKLNKNKGWIRRAVSKLFR